MGLPKEINTGFVVDEKRLWKIKIPTEEIDINEVIHNLEIPYLESIGINDWNLSPGELIKNFKREKLHAKKVLEADLKYPIEIYRHNSRWIILDGVHRFTKIIMEDRNKN